MSELKDYSKYKSVQERKYWKKEITLAEFLQRIGVFYRNNVLNQKENGV